ncbi:MAG TPA: tetratricopeptide repeat protein [Planctomycetota bacterium]|nr:tetratricopeptide repeat protein [Planctomycetota bacterium]
MPGDSLDKRYRERATNADLPRREARDRDGSTLPVAPRGRIDYASPSGKRTISPSGSPLRTPEAPARIRGGTVTPRTLGAARSRTSLAFAKDPVVVVNTHWNRTCWNWGVDWWRSCHSGFFFRPFLFDPWCASWSGWHSWWNWSWCRSRWCWSWGSWCDPFWAWSWWWPWSASVVYVPGPTTVYVEQPASSTVYLDREVPVPSEEGRSEGTAPGAYGGKAAESLTEKYVRLADLYFRAGRYDRAVEHYLRATEYAPEQGSLWFMLSDALFAIGDYHFAAYAIRKGVEKDPTLVESRANKREFYGNPADFEAHILQLGKFLADHGNDGDAWLVLAYNQFFTGAIAEAKGSFQKAKEHLAADRAIDLFLAAADVREAEASMPATEPATKPPGEIR